MLFFVDILTAFGFIGREIDAYLNRWILTPSVQWEKGSIPVYQHAHDQNRHRYPNKAPYFAFCYGNDERPRRDSQSRE